jgi:4a-hydroxytetrahydrobiopterin dehydratase
MATKLTDAERDNAVAGLPGWKYEAGAKALIRDFKFRDFSEAFGFMARVALLAQAANHHPDWSNKLQQGERAVVDPRRRRRDGQ